MKTDEIIKRLLENLGLDPESEYLKDTPSRVRKMLEFITSGYRVNIEELFEKSVFTKKYDQMIIVKDIDFFSMCEHHLLPFYGKIHIGYMPKEKVIGLSKLARIAEAFSRRLQVQERMTQEIAESIEKYLKPTGVGVVVEARHLCMMMRGVEKVNSIITTSVMLGTFKEDEKTRREFLNLIKTQ